MRPITDFRPELRPAIAALQADYERASDRYEARNRYRHQGGTWSWCGTYRSYRRWERALNALPARDEAMLRLRFLQQERILDIARLYDMCPARASQLKEQALRWCRWRLGINTERDYPRFDPEHRALSSWLGDQNRPPTLDTSVASI